MKFVENYLANKLRNLEDNEIAEVLSFYAKTGTS